MKTKKQRGYLHRLSASLHKYPHLFPVGSESILHLVHDHWCMVYRGKECNCYPEVTVTTGQCTYAIMHDGSCVNVN